MRRVAATSPVGTLVSRSVVRKTCEEEEEEEACASLKSDYRKSTESGLRKRMRAQSHVEGVYFYMSSAKVFKLFRVLAKYVLS